MYYFREKFARTLYFSRNLYQTREEVLLNLRFCYSLIFYSSEMLDFDTVVQRLATQAGVSGSMTWNGTAEPAGHCYFITYKPYVISITSHINPPPSTDLEIEYGS